MVAGSLIASGLHRVRHRALYPAMMAPVTEVDDHANRQPDDETPPGVNREAGHQGEGNHDTQDWNEWHQGGLEGTMQFRTSYPENPHTCAYDNERQQRTDAHEFAKNPDGNQGGEDGHEQSDGYGRDPGSAKLGMHRARPLRQQPIARHGEEHAGLAQQHYQHHTTQAGNGAQLHQNRAP